MRKTPLLLALAVVVLLAGPAAILGCGDKFVVLGRGVRYGRAFAAKYPASVLLYANPASHMPAAMKEFRLEATLKAAGHKTRVVESAGDLEQALVSGKYDLVLADIADSPRLQKDAASSASKPTVVPVLYKPTPAELADVEKKYGCLIAPASSRSPDLLPVLDQAMQSRARGSRSLPDGDLGDLNRADEGHETASRLPRRDRGRSRAADMGRPASSAGVVASGRGSIPVSRIRKRFRHEPLPRDANEPGRQRPNKPGTHPFPERHRGAGLRHHRPV